MSERTTQDLLRRGLEIVDSYAVWQSDVVGVGHDAEALRAVAAVVRRELEAPGAGKDVRERIMGVSRVPSSHRAALDAVAWP